MKKVFLQQVINGLFVKGKNSDATCGFFPYELKKAIKQSLENQSLVSSLLNLIKYQSIVRK